MTEKMRIEIDALGRGKLFLGDVDISRGCTGFDIRCRVNQVSRATIYFLTSEGVEGALENPKVRALIAIEERSQDELREFISGELYGCAYHALIEIEKRERVYRIVRATRTNQEG